MQLQAPRTGTTCRCSPSSPSTGSTPRSVTTGSSSLSSPQSSSRARFSRLESAEPGSATRPPRCRFCSSPRRPCRVRRRPGPALLARALPAAAPAPPDREARAPTRLIWLVVPLFALWSNLHGAALVGMAVAGAYLILERGRRRPLESAAILILSGLALLATPALGGTASYYIGVLQNEAAARGAGLWAPLSLTAPLDILFLAAALPLVALALRSRPPLWELGALAGLVLLTIQSARGGVWLAFMLAVPAAAGLRPLRERPIRLGGAAAWAELRRSRSQASSAAPRRRSQRRAARADAPGGGGDAGSRRAACSRAAGGGRRAAVARESP